MLRSKYHFREKCGLKQIRGAPAKRALPVNPAPSRPHFFSTCSMDGECCENKMIRRTLCMPPKSMHVAGEVTGRTERYLSPNQGITYENSTTTPTYEQIFHQAELQWIMVTGSHTEASRWRIFLLLTAGGDDFHSLDSAIQDSSWPINWDPR